MNYRPASPPPPRTRRRLLRIGLAALAAGILPLPRLQQGQLQFQAGFPLISDAQAQTGTVWRNWSGIVECKPQSIATPGTEAEILQLLQNAKQLRCSGSGHSFTPLVASDVQLVSLDRLAGITAQDGTLVTLKAGTRLAQLSRQLDERKLGLPNLPDIDTQTIAGAIATGTHGTGAKLQALHASIEELRLLTPKGEIITCNSGAPQMLDAARVSLGCLGIITEVKIRAVPAFNLQRKVWLKPVEELLLAAPDLARKHRHFEFYYLPFTGYAAAITHDEYAGQDVKMPPAQDEDMLRDLRRLRDWAGSFPSLRRWLAAKLIDPNTKEEAQNRSFKLLSNSRPTRFNESECHVPRQAGIDCVREVIAKLEQRNEVFFPLEFRYVKADDAWLSPFYKRDSCSIAVHAAVGEPYDYLVKEIGPIFRKYEGRPHWGKLHQYSSGELAALYPRWHDFQAIRRALDPQNKLLNAHLRQIFGVA